MCPFCLANIALLAAATASTGGLTAFAVKKLHVGGRAREISKRFKRRIKSRATAQESRHRSSTNVNDRQHFSSFENC
jgi:hypothetical protein